MRIGIGLAGLAMGGCRINALDIAATMRRRGHEVTVFAIHDDPKVSVLPIAAQRGVEVRVLPSSDRALVTAARLARLAKTHRLDVLHVFGDWMARPSAVAAAASGCLPVATNWKMHNVPGLPPRMPLILGTQALHAEAQAGRPGPVWLMEPPVDVAHDTFSAGAAADFRRSYGLGEEDELVVVVSRLDEAMKASGIESTMRALEVCGRPGVRLAVVGDGDAAQRLRTTGAEVNARLGRPAVTFTGALDDPTPAYSAADLFLGMGGAALRALSFGKKVVVLGEDGFFLPFRQSTTSYFKEHGFFGQGHDGDPVADLSREIVTMLDLPTVELAEYSRRFVTERYGLESSTDRLLGEYATALQRRTRTGAAKDAAYVVVRELAREVVRR